MHKRVWLFALMLAPPAVMAASAKKDASKKPAVVDAGVPDAAPEVPVNTDPCAHNVTCSSCVTSMTVSCGWCVEGGTCVYRDDGACGAGFMASLATQCPPPGGVRAPMPKASTMATPNAGVVLGPAIIGDEEFTALLDAFSEENNEAARFTRLEETAATHHFRVAQAMQLVDNFPTAAVKLKVCELLKTRVTDKQNLFQFYGRFKSDADKKKAQKIMEGKN